MIVDDDAAHVVQLDASVRNDSESERGMTLTTSALGVLIYLAFGICPSRYAQPRNFEGG